MDNEKKVLMENPEYNYFVEQNFPVVEWLIGGHKYKAVQVISFNGKIKVNCDHFSVEVVKDTDGFVSFIVVGKLTTEEQIKAHFYRYDVWIMRTDDFNKAYDLRNRLSGLIDKFAPNKKQEMPCYGSLQREKLPFGQEGQEEAK